ncbi:hypothetical protein M758_3G132200 [Ceratodon purpureus]|nr:hypothetical protein M758_3G132200 [Ceratodon purpureus]
MLTTYLRIRSSFPVYSLCLQLTLLHLFPCAPLADSCKRACMLCPMWWYTNVSVQPGLKLKPSVFEIACHSIHRRLLNAS